MTATYNPFRAATAAAFSELSSESAQRYYSLKGQKDVQNALDASVTLCAWVCQLAQISYMMGVQCRAWCDELEAQAPAPVRSSLLLAPAKDTPMVAPVEAGMKLLSDAIRSGMSLITQNTEEFPPMDEEITPGALLMLPPASSIVYGSVWNPAPTNMHIKVQRLLQATAAPAEAEAELVGALNVPGATGKRTSRANVGTDKAGAKPKGARAKAKV